MTRRSRLFLDALLSSVAAVQLLLVCTCPNAVTITGLAVSCLGLAYHLTAHTKENDQ